MPGLENLHLEDSFVLDISSQPGAVTFTVDFVLTAGHPQYSPAIPGEQHCYRRGSLVFVGVTESHWRKQRGESATADPGTGERDFDSIDSLFREGAVFSLEGSWGEMQITASRVEVTLLGLNEVRPRLDPAELPQVSEWLTPWVSSSGETSLTLYRDLEVGLSRMIVAAGLLVPEFVESHGCVVLKENYTEENFAGWWHSLDGDVARVEGVLNHTHISDLFMNDDFLETAVDSALRDLAQFMGLTWRAALRSRFPDRLFTVQVTDDLDGPTVAFWSVRPDSL